MNNLYIVTRYTPDGFLAGTIPSQWMYELQRIIAEQAQLLEMIRWRGGILHLGKYVELYWTPIHPELKNALIGRIAMITQVPVSVDVMMGIEVIRTQTRAFYGQKHSKLKEVIELSKAKNLKLAVDEFKELYNYSPPYSEKPDPKSIIDFDADADAIKKALLEIQKPHEKETKIKSAGHGGSNLSALGGTIHCGELSKPLKSNMFPASIWETSSISPWNIPIKTVKENTIPGLTSEAYLNSYLGEKYEHTHPDDQSNSAHPGKGQHSGSGKNDDEPGAGDEPTL